MQLTAQSKAIFRKGIARTKAAQKAAKELAALVLAQPEASQDDQDPTVKCKFPFVKTGD
jgi:hypothetical protein